MTPLMEFRNVSKEYKTGERTFYALKDASFTIEAGEMVVILGPSGAGKSTLLNLLGGMDSASGGSILFEGEDLTSYSDNQLTQYRAKNVGVVFQFYNLIPTLTAYENVALMKDLEGGKSFAGKKKDADQEEHMNPAEALAAVGLAEHMHQFPSQLSGGEQQRTSIARAIAKNPKLLLADEPTGALDYVTGVQILELLQKVCREDGMTVVIITHNSIIAPMADRVIRFRSGKVISQTDNPDPEPVENLKW